MEEFTKEDGPMENKMDKESFSLTIQMLGEREFGVMEKESDGRIKLSLF